MRKLWSKGSDSHALVDIYCFDEGVVLDNNLVEEDVYGSIAHVHALEKLKIVDKTGRQALVQTLVMILGLFRKGDFIVEPGDEDVHTKIENFLTDKLGSLGKKIHTARSRNDQVLVDLRLFSKKRILEAASHVGSAIEYFAEYAIKFEYVPMQGYTHMQKAISSKKVLLSWGRRRVMRTVDAVG